MAAKSTLDRGNISPSDGLRAAIYGVNAVLVGVTHRPTKRTLARARTLLVEAQNLLHQSIVDGEEPRVWR